MRSVRNARRLHRGGTALSHRAPEGPPRAVVFSTDDVSESERFDYWREMTTQAFVALRPERVSEAPFSGSIHAGKLGSQLFAHVQSGAQRVYRTSAEIARSSRSTYFVNLQVAGESTLRHGGAEHLMRPGDFALIDTTRPLELGFRGPFRHATLELPHHALRPKLVDPDRAPGTVIRGEGGLGALVSGYLGAAARMSERADPQAGDALGENLVGLLALAFGAEADEQRLAAPSLEDAKRRAACVYVERHLADASLSPASIARALKISTRYLHKLFERGDETLMQRVVRRRLERCRDDLANPSLRGKSITDIAFTWGFNDLSHFGRAFKAVYQESPRAYRGHQGKPRK